MDRRLYGYRRRGSADPAPTFCNTTVTDRSIMPVACRASTAQEPKNWSKINAKQPHCGRCCSLSDVRPRRLPRSRAPAQKSRRSAPRLRRSSARLDRLEQARRAGAARRRRRPLPAPAPRSSAVEARRRGRAPEPSGSAGDLRYRHETINEDGRGRAQPAAHPRPVRGYGRRRRQRPVWASRSRRGGDDPVSANQTLDTGFNRKPIGIDRAFFSWAATEQLTFTGGKIATPFFRPGNHHLIYDNDLNPEGLALRYTRGDWFANYAGLWVEERGADDDSIMLGGQFGLSAHARQRHAHHRRCGLLRLPRNAGPHAILGRCGRWQSARRGGSYLNDFNLAQLFGRAQPEGR